jgi:nucleoside-diphosphate-sugar epimerase
MKGQIEDNLASLGLARLLILRPGILTGPRSGRRPGEEIGVRLIRALNVAGLFRAYRPIHADAVARAMIVAAFRPDRCRIYEPAEVFDLAAESGPR